MLLTSKAAHRQILKAGDAILAELRAYRPDFEVAVDISLADTLAEPGLQWKIRRPAWPAGCALALESNASYSDVYFGVLEPALGAQGTVRKQVETCEARERLDAALGDIAGGRHTPWWPWYQYSRVRKWDHQFAGALVLESSTACVRDHPEVQYIASRVAELAAAVERAVLDWRKAP